MKKIVVVLIVFVANIVSVDAMKLEVRKEDEVDEFDKWLIANLANPYDEMKIMLFKNDFRICKSKL